MSAACIVIDWGTSNCRAYLLDQQGEVLESLNSKQGILKVAPGEFSSVFETLIAPWQSFGALPVVMAGMVGSAQGWVEVPYQACPFNLNELSAHLFRVPDEPRDVFIVPGLQTGLAAGRADVMRGEETQLLGALDKDTQVYCLPGTHSKWVWVENDSVQHFTTYLTGELYALLAHHSILAKQMRADENHEAEFLRGLQQAQEDSGLLADLFNVRAQVLLGQMKAGMTRDYLSGLLIGHEIESAKKDWISSKKVTIIAADEVASRYQRALEHVGVDVTVIDGADAVVRGVNRMNKDRGVSCEFE